MARVDAPSLNPALQPADPELRRWLAQVTLRLRREITWLRHAREAPAGAVDVVQEALDLTRFQAEKQAFFDSDATARWLGERIAEAAQVPKAPTKASAQAARRATQASPGSATAKAAGAAVLTWRRAVTELGLDEAAQFVLACALAARADAAFGAVAAQALGDPHLAFASLALAQRLWDDPMAILPCADPSHALYGSGLLAAPAARDVADWTAPLLMPAPVAHALLDEPSRAPAGLRALQPAGTTAADASPLVHWLRATPVRSMQIVPVVAQRGADIESAVGAVAAAAGRAVAAFGPEIGPRHFALPGLAAAAWLRGFDLLAPESWVDGTAGHEPGEDWTAAVAAMPLRWYVPFGDAGLPRAGGAALYAPALVLAPLAVSERRRRFEAAAARGVPAAERPTAKARAADAARRFRIEERAVARIEAAMLALARSDPPPDVFELAQAESAAHLGQLATPLVPRFDLGELVLPPREARALAAIVDSMRTIGRVHDEWGTARAWNESGLAVMFAGPSGTGKTMAAEALARTLALPMYRIDLSQVVNKYIGETEKNLRRIFDAAESADCLLLFDEADALFGKRTEVRDSHDRYANLEISYLLERMERFKGLAILATNRRKDLDEAFMRRLRYVVEFPVPGPTERERIWRQVFPPAVDISGVDLDFLSRRFEVAGGAIRSAAFNACLQAAARGGKPAVAMTDVARAMKSELEKGGREIADEQFGSYAHLLREDRR
jgi:hypothetical protein